MDSFKKDLISLKLQTGDPVSIANYCEKLIESFPIIFQELKVLSGDDQKQRTLINDTLSIWFVRAIKFKSELSHDGNDVQFQKIEKILDTYNIYTYIFQYTIDFWTDSGSALANSLKGLFLKMCTFMKKCATESSEFFKQWLLQCLNDINKNMKVRYFLFDNLLDMIHVEDAEALIFKCYTHDFVSELLQSMSSNILAFSAGKTLSTLVVDLYKQKSPTEFPMVNSYWINNTIDHIKMSQPSTVKNIETYLLSPIFKNSPIEVFKSFIQKVEGDIPLLLSLLKIGQELDISQEPFHKGSNELISLDNVVNKLLQSSIYKNSAFELLTFNCKSSKPLQPYLYDIILSNLNIFFVDYDVSSRNYFESVFKRFIYRIKDSTYSLNRTVEKLKLKNKFPEEQEEKSREVERSKVFLRQLLQTLKFQLVPNSQYQRVLSSLRILNILLESGLDSRIDEKFYDKKQRTTDWCFHLDIVDESILRLLYDNLTYSFEDVKELSVKILSMIFTSQKFADEEKYQVNESLLLETGLRLCTFYKGCIPGAKILEFMAIIYSNKKDVQKLNDLIELLLSKLEECIQNAATDYLGALEYPINGYFLSLSLILASSSVKIDEEYITRMLSAVKRNWENSAEILCHDSPEGNLPLRYMTSGVSDQVITSYAFRSVNESSTLTETLINNPHFLTDDELVTIGDLLIYQLTTIRHSGAFQAVAPTYAACCVAVNKRVPNKLVEWMQIIVDSLESKSQHITRRSGGFPFLVTAILSAENPKSDRPLLHYTFDNLLRMANVPIVEHEDKLDLTQVHALNCMKGIFVESKLGECSNKYIYPALELCLNNFQSPLWSMRNCSIMLFTALQNRLFGKMSKTTSARLFFTKYQGIKEILLAQLTSAVNETKSTQIECIFLVLTIISRLKPTPGFDGLKEFSPLLVKCLESDIWKIREIAARALPIVSANMADSVRTLLKSLSSCPLLSQNKLHGYLLAVKEFLLAGCVLSTDLEALIYDMRFKCLISNPCCSTANEYMHLLKVIPSFKELSVINLVANFFVDHYSDMHWYGSKQLLMKSVVEFLLEFEDKQNIVDILLLSLTSNSFEVQSVAIEYITINNVASEHITKSLVGLLQQKETWTHIKSQVLIALQSSKTSASPETLIGILESSDESDDLKASSLQSLGSCLSESYDKVYWELIKKNSDDDLELPFRAAALNSLLNLPIRPDSLFNIALFLQDDDDGLRLAASEFLCENYLDGFYSDIPNVVFKRFFEKFNGSSSSISLVYLKNHLSTLSFNFSDAISYSEELFDSEPANVIRNIPEVLFHISTKVQLNNEGLDEQFSALLKEKAQSLVAHFEILTVNDSAFGWGSDSKLFNEIASIMILSNIFDPISYEMVTKAAASKRCTFVQESIFSSISKPL